jgi:hypothetical protein
LEEEEGEQEEGGGSLEEEDGGERDRSALAKNWCPFTYEYLPHFCFTCGIIGHTDKECSFKLGKGDKQLYTKDYGKDLGKDLSGQDEEKRHGKRKIQ